MNITVLQGDITKVFSNVIVNAANVAMRGGGGVDGAIHRAAGPELDAYESWMYPHGLSGVGCPALTPAFGLPAKHIVHVAGPDVRSLLNCEAHMRDEFMARWWIEMDEELWNAYARSLVLAGLTGAHTVTFPSLSTGIFGFPLERAVPLAVSALREAADRAPSVRVASIVAFDRRRPRRSGRRCEQEAPAIWPAS